MRRFTRRLRCAACALLLPWQALATPGRRVAPTTTPSSLPALPLLAPSLPLAPELPSLPALPAPLPPPDAPVAAAALPTTALPAVAAQALPVPAALALPEAARAVEAATTGEEDAVAEKPVLSGLNALSAAADPEPFWTNARALGADAAVAAPAPPLSPLLHPSSEPPSEPSAEAPRPREAPPRLIRPGPWQELRDAATYLRIYLHSLAWYTFPRLFERWEEFRVRMALAPAGRAVRDAVGFFIAHRVLGSTGSYGPMGFRVANNETVVQDAWAIYDDYFRAGPDARAAFGRFLERAERFNPNRRSTQFRKIIFHALRHGALLSPADLPAFFDVQADESEADALRRFQRDEQHLVVSAFAEAVRGAVLEVNASLPAGKRVLGVVLLGSFANGAASPGSDLDVQVVTEHGGTGHMERFHRALLARWKDSGYPNPVSFFEYALRPSAGLIHRVHHEPYRVVSPFPEVVAALKPDPAAVEKRSRHRDFFGWVSQESYRIVLRLVLAFYDRFRRKTG